MSPAGFNAHAHQREFAEARHEPPYYLVVRDCRAGIFVRLRGHARPSQGIAAHTGIDGASLPLQGSLDQRNVGLLHLPAGKHFAQGGVGAVVLGYNDQAAGVLVEAMHDAGAQVAAGG